MRQRSTGLLLLCATVGAASNTAYADQSSAQGLFTDDHLTINMRNAYFGRDRMGGAQDKAEWGQSFIAKYNSGFTAGTVGVGFDLLGQYALKLDTGRGRNNSGIAFFPVKNAQPDGTNDGSENDIVKAGGAIKFRVSNTVIAYGDQLPALPVVHFDPTRLLPETFTGTTISSDEWTNLHLDAGRLTRDSSRNTSGRDSARLQSLTYVGGTYRFSRDLSAGLYYSENEDVARKKYVNVNYVYPIDKHQALAFDFNMYDTHYDSKYTGDGSQRNNIWSLASSYKFDSHSVTVGYQRNTGSRSYDYNIGDGGTIYMANSYFSDFILEDERSWQLSYEYNFANWGFPGLNFKSAYVTGDNITTSTGTDGHEREWFNQFAYTVQEGKAKDLTARLRSSIYRADSDVNDYYAPDMNEIRVYIDYPLQVF